MSDPVRPAEVEETHPLPEGLPDLLRQAQASGGERRGRFQLISLLGQGGMGEVYKAYDPLLDRFIALKILRGHGTALLLREARAQARVEHELICKVYEVGELEGGPYIAMRFVDGPPLDVATKGMPVETRVRLFRKVAGALHEAHREGLVHRDVKPSNILVETLDDGTFRPIIVDFGLALDQDASRSVTRSAVGTPAYMAPEQAQGQTARIDRRTDVYSLGVTMWEALAEELMIDGASVAAVLMKVVNDDPVPLRERRPEIPVDLATIVMKCLEKEPERRYDSARALADDLGRFLDGDPIAARPVSRVERLARRARKNRAVTAALGVAVLSTIVFGGAAMRTSLMSARRQAAAQELGQSVQRMEWTLRQAYLLPRHDIRPARQKVREEMRRMELEIGRRGSLAAGPGAFALARGHLALGHPEEAREALEKALANGYRTPEVESTLGRTLLELYQRELRRADQLPTPEARVERRDRIARDLKEPALAHLRASRDSEGTALLEGLIAFLEERFDLAREKAREVYGKDPAQYEALKLAGETEVVRGRKAQQGGDYETALAAYDAAGRAFREAGDVARSDPRVFISECDRLVFRMEVDLRLGRDEVPSYEAARAACRTALAVDPEMGRAHTLLCRLEWHEADALAGRGADESAAIAASVEAGQRAVSIDARDASAWANLGIAFWSQGEAEARHGRDARPSLRQAAQALSTAEKLEPTGSNLMDLGSVFLEIGRAEQKAGDDPTPSFDSAEETYASALLRMPRESRLHSNMGNISSLRAAHLVSKGADPIPALEQAIGHYGKAIELNPRNPIALFNLGETLLERGRREALSGRDPEPYLARALESDRKALEVNPRLAVAHGAIAAVHLVRAERAADPGPSLAEAPCRSPTTISGRRPGRWAKASIASRGIE